MTGIIEYTPSNTLIAEFPEFRKITIYGTAEEPLFPLAQVQEFLEIGQIRVDRGDYEAGEDFIKIKCPGRDGHHEYNQYLLTEDGLYRVLYKSNSQVGKKFRRFAKVVMRELRLRGHVTLDGALEKLKELEIELAERDNKIAQMDQQLEEEHAMTMRYQLESAKFYTQKMAALERCLTLETRADDQSNSPQYNTEAQLERIKDHCMKRLYIYMIKPPAAIADEFPEFDENSDPPEDDEICFTICTRQLDKIACAEVHIYKDVPISALYNRLSLAGFDIIKGKRKFRGYISHVREIINSML